ncbi:esterase/lipase family protein [Streptomyces sp. NPDC086023]|uniref:esterase/lipase family protein n=1 Tax=Streptomyces sp. NPDC086023 TaxID=3365746 RepID=UPI0037D5CC15
MGLSHKLPTTALRATVLELAILAAHLLVYPTGVLAERRPAAPRPPHPDEVSLRGTPRPPVVLLHGFTDNRSVFLLLRRVLAEGGRHHVETLNYSPLTTDLRAAARRLARQVEEVLVHTGQDRVDLVGHSLGGLVARYYVQRLGGDARVRAVVTLGTPHHGTRIAPLMDAHPLVRQMRPDSALLTELAAPAPGCQTRFASFWTDLDQLMVPVTTARLDHPDLITENIQVTGIGHLALPAHPAVAAHVRRILSGDAPGTLLEPGAASGSISVA